METKAVFTVSRGSVTDGATGQPVVLARVEAQKGCRGSPGFVRRDDRTRALPPAQRGAYEISGLPVGTYNMRVEEGGAMCGGYDRDHRC